MSFIRNSIESLFGGSDAARTTSEAAEVQADAQREALDYLREVDQPLVDAREEALPALSGFFGIGEGSQQDIIDQVQASPFYDFNLEQAENAILRNKSATGGLRSGSAQRALGESAMNVTQNLVDQQLAGLQQFAFPPLSTSQQSAVMQDIGSTQAQGMIGAEQARQSAFGQGLNVITNAAKAASGFI